MRIYLTGSITIEGRRAVLRETDLPGAQGRHLLTLLAAEHRRPHSRAELAEELWDGSPPQAWDSAVRLLVHKLRALLASLGETADPISTAAGCYQFRLPSSAWVDLDAARHAINHAESALDSSRISDAHAEAQVACSITRRPFLPGVYGPWASARRRELESLRVRALECTSEIWLRVGETRQAVHCAQLAVDLDRYSETAVRQLMRAHTARGDRLRAARTYRVHREIAARELGAPPSPETQELVERLRLNA